MPFSMVEHNPKSQWVRHFRHSKLYHWRPYWSSRKDHRHDVNSTSSINLGQTAPKGCTKGKNRCTINRNTFYIFSFNYFFALNYVAEAKFAGALCMTCSSNVNVYFHASRNCPVESNRFINEHYLYA